MAIGFPLVRTGSLGRVRARVRVWVGLGLCLGASESSIADCWQGIPGE